MRGDSPNSGTTDSCKEDSANRVFAELLNSLMSLWRRHFSVQTLKADVIGVQRLTGKVEHLSPVRENDAGKKSFATRGNGSRTDHLLIGSLVPSSLYDSRFFMSAATFEEGL